MAEVLWIDRFGNAQLNVDPTDVDPFGERVRLRVGGDVRTARVVASYDQIGSGEVGLVVDSYGVLSIAAGQRSAAKQLELRVGTSVRLDGLDDEGDAPAPRGVVTPVRIASPGASS